MPSDSVLRSLNRRLKRVERQSARVRIDADGARNLVWQGGVIPVGGTNGGSWQPLDSDLTAIAALTTTVFGRNLLTLSQLDAGGQAIIGLADGSNMTDAVTVQQLIGGMATKQGVDADLTAIAALTTTAYGRALLTLADQAALVALLPSYQPLDADLTALAGVATQAYGRGLLAYATEAAFKQGVNLEIGVDVQAYDSGLQILANASDAGTMGLSVLACVNYAALLVTLGVGNASGIAGLDAAGRLPSAQLTVHGHPISDVTGLQDALNAKQATVTAGDALTFTGATLDVEPGFGLEINADTIRVAAALAGDGLTGGAGSALAVSPGAGLEISADAVRIAAAAAGDGLTGGAGSALAVNPGTGLEISADTVRVAAALAGTGLTGGGGSALSVVFGTGSGQVTQGNDSRIPTTDEKAALAGTADTPSNANRYVTDSDPLRRPTQLALNDAAVSLGLDVYVTLGATDGLNDLTANNRDGTNVGLGAIGGGASLNSESEGSTVFPTQTQYFDSDYVSFAYQPFGSAQSTGCTSLFGWFDEDLTTGSAWLFGTSTTWQGGLRMEYGANSRTFHYHNGISSPENSWVVPNAALGARNMWALYIDLDTDEIELFINGVSRGKQGPTYPWQSGTHNLWIGYCQNATYPNFVGKQSHFGAVKKRLSPETFRWLYRIGIGSAKDWGIVSSLPSSSQSVPGDTCTYIADATNGIYWSLVYDGLGSYPWKFVGGPPLYHEVTTSQGTTSASYGNLATTGPTVTCPVAGDYDIEHGARVQALNTSGHMSYQFSATGASDADAIEDYLVYGVNMQRRRRKTIASAAQAITAKYRAGTAGQTADFLNRYLAVTPVRVG